MHGGVRPSTAQPSPLSSPVNPTLSGLPHSGRRAVCVLGQWRVKKTRTFPNSSPPCTPASTTSEHVSAHRCPRGSFIFFYAWWWSPHDNCTTRTTTDLGAFSPTDKSSNSKFLSFLPFLPARLQLPTKITTSPPRLFCRAQWRLPSSTPRRPPPTPTRPQRISSPVPWAVSRRFSLVCRLSCN